MPIKLYGYGISLVFDDFRLPVLVRSIRNVVLGRRKLTRGLVLGLLVGLWVTPQCVANRLNFCNVVIFGSRNLRALAYEYMKNGSLEKFLFGEDKKLGFNSFRPSQLALPKGLLTLHEECQQRFIHYDIKSGNILLDANIFPKLADFGLAMLCNRDNTHVTLTGGRGTPEFAAPEL
ncbi:hypothetical protein F3Y22_tig00110114pilonHSYRG00115 [Hibiscus syriacus]|uniref:Protein kinase domain-containing protein n=1 Tax=Hibiscus syriacus TaxID=106335 RepID=A0A6A3BHI8_HIBSY|nr:hypothetical protein F3Y22_tig00110114pilonHSYRG00115 [Hibiscus syriacus]